VSHFIFDRDSGKKRATITINRPEKLNACTSEMWRELTRLFIQAEQDEEINVIVIKGAGRVLAQDTM